MSSSGERRTLARGLRDALVREKPHGKSIGATILARTLADRRVLLRKSMRALDRYPEASSEWPVSESTPRD